LIRSTRALPPFPQGYQKPEGYQPCSFALRPDKKRLLNWFAGPETRSCPLGTIQPASRQRNDPDKDSKSILFVHLTGATRVYAP